MNNTQPNKIKNLSIISIEDEHGEKVKSKQRGEKVTAVMTTHTNKKKTQQGDKKKIKKRRVRFGDIDIYSYPQILGDNPGTSDGGAPLTITWKPNDWEVVEVDYYEYNRCPRRTRRNLKIPRVDREIYLLSIGYSMEEILHAAEKVAKIKKDRLLSLQQSQKWDKFKNVFENTKAKLKHVVHKIEKKHRQEHFKLYTKPKCTIAKSA